MPVTKIIASNFEMFSGDSKLLTVTVKDQDDAIVDIAGATISMEISKTPNSSALVTKAGTITDAPNGVFTVDIDPADTASLRGAHYYEIELTDASGRVSTVVAGTVTIKQDAVS